MEKSKPISSVCSCVNKDLEGLASGMGFHDPHLQMTMDFGTEKLRVVVYCRKCGGFWSYEDISFNNTRYETIHTEVSGSPCLSFDLYQQIAERMTKALASLGPLSPEEMKLVLETSYDYVGEYVGLEVFITVADRLGFFDPGTEMICFPPEHPLVPDDEHKQSDDR